MKKELIFLRTLSIMLLCVLFATQANAQGLNISGTVNDDFGPVTGASVLVKGTSNGCITDCISQCIFRRNLGHFIHWLSNTRSSGKQSAEVFHQLKRGLTTTTRSSGYGSGLW